MAAVRAAGPQAPREEVHQRLLELLAEQSRRVPVGVGVLMVVVAWMASRVMPPWIPAVWLLAALAILMVRREWLGKLPRQTELPTPVRVRTAIRLSLLNGTTHGLSLAAFPLLPDIERPFFTLLLLGLSTGAVGTTAGHRKIYLAYALPAAGTLPIWWAIHPNSPIGWYGLALALLIVLYLWVLYGLAHNAWHNFTDSVNMRFLDRERAAQLTEALAQANQANQAKTRFLAAASHDLRQPLHTIGLLVAALSLRPIEGRDREVVDLLSQVTVALSEQLDQLLDISKLDAGVVAPDKKMVDLAEMLRMHHAEMRAAIEEKGLRAVIDVQGSVRCWTDPALVLRVLRNLTENAIKFTPQGHVALRMRVEGGDACISVEDTGRGIPPAEQAMVFEEFYQVDNPERDRSKGLGLGLSIVKRLCGLLGVTLQLHSTEGQGTRVTMRLPLDTFGAAATVVPEPAHNWSFAGVTVLVIDDERSVRMGMRVLLEELGCRFVEACSVEEATREAIATKPDVILADMRLRNGETGITAISSVTSAVGATPALLISGDTAPDRLQEANRAGIKLLHKPVALPMLQAELARMLGDKVQP
ncbi:ATP-binding response regulator [Ramlibacter pallidus]|uniref:histidine kinase n=1 Tax=Ramlibacter pallidus TaxID=2780087 RepID=A0ABR9RXZ8_9BURK|nr:hybrid sensor histidine kinase/response regulator [Ramlibacter pallidus]MBE7366104.1 hybrid sensor histidine kinase/response regulator [Ramlibacter pallidus]